MRTTSLGESSGLGFKGLADCATADSGPIKTQKHSQKHRVTKPGGKLGVYTGMLKVAETQDQLAAVIGHEVAHVLAGHSAERVSEQMAAQLGVTAAGAATGIDPQMFGIATSVFFLLPHSRTQESEADILGLNYMAKAGFDPRQAPQLWRNMAKTGGQKPPEMLSTHPSDETRINGLTHRLSSAMPLYEQARGAGKQPMCSQGG